MSEERDDADDRPRTSRGEIPSVLEPAPETPPIDLSSFPAQSFSSTVPRGETASPEPKPSSTSTRDNSRRMKAEEEVAKPVIPEKRPRSPPPRSMEGSPQLQPEGEDQAMPEAGPSVVPQVVKRVVNKNRQVKKKVDGIQLQYTNSFVPLMFNVKNPAGDFIQKDSNVDVIHQVSVARARKEKEDAAAELARRVSAGEEVPEVNPLSQILIIHPGSRNLRIGRASDFYPKEIPNCIARPSIAANRGHDPPVPGSRAKRVAAEAKAAKERKRRRGEEITGHVNGGGGKAEDDALAEWIDPVEKHIGNLREYLQNKLRANRLSTDYKEGDRVRQTNARVRPEPIPEFNDPYRIEYTETNGKKFFVGTDAIRLPSDSGCSVRYPLLQRNLNTRDWASSQQLVDDIATILIESLQTELGIHPREYHSFSAVLIVPDHSDRLYVQTLTHLLFGEFGFKELAIHQESHTAIFAAGMSTACVVDIGATQTSVSCVDEGFLNQDTRINLQYGADDITAALVTLLTRANFPYRELNLAKAMEWKMMDDLKIRICTLEEHMVANTPWDVYVLKEQGLTQKYIFRTYDENILAPLCFFDTRMIDFEEKKGRGRFSFWGTNEDVDDLLISLYNEPTGAMRACTVHLLPAPPIVRSEVPVISTVDTDPTGTVDNGEDPVKIELGNSTRADGDTALTSDHPKGNGTAHPSEADQAGNSAHQEALAGSISAANLTAKETGTESPAPPATAPIPAAPEPEASNTPAVIDFDTVEEASKSPLDAAIAASISMAGTENKIKAAAGSILLIGGGSALKGLYPFIAERLPPLLREKGLPIQDVSIVPPPRNLNPRRDEWEAMGAKALKDRLLFL